MLTAQIIMLLTLLVMILGRAPLYITATIGSTLAAIAAGFPLIGKDPNSIGKLLVSAMNPVIKGRVKWVHIASTSYILDNLTVSLIIDSKDIESIHLTIAPYFSKSFFNEEGV